MTTPSDVTTTTRLAFDRTRLAHERTLRGQPDLLALLREEIMAAISKHVSVVPEKVQVRLDRGQSVSTLATDIEIPSLVPAQT